MTHNATGSVPAKTDDLLHRFIAVVRLRNPEDMDPEAPSHSHDFNAGLMHICDEFIEAEMHHMLSQISVLMRSAPCWDRLSKLEQGNLETFLLHLTEVTSSLSMIESLRWEHWREPDQRIAS